MISKRHRNGKLSLCSSCLAELKHWVVLFQDFRKESKEGVFAGLRGWAQSVRGRERRKKTDLRWTGIVLRIPDSPCWTRAAGLGWIHPAHYHAAKSPGILQLPHYPPCSSSFPLFSNISLNLQSHSPERQVGWGQGVVTWLLLAPQWQESFALAAASVLVLDLTAPPFHSHVCSSFMFPLSLSDTADGIGTMC